MHRSMRQQAVTLVIVGLALAGVEARNDLRAHGRSLLEVKEALIGYQQGVVLGIAPGTTGECLVSGVPTPSGYTPPASSPLLLATPKGSGVHIVTFAPTVTGTTVTPAIVYTPASLAYSSGDPAGPPLLAFDASLASEGESGVAVVTLNDGAGVFLCSSTISFTVVAPLGCAPAAPGGSVVPTVIGGTVYVNQLISTTIIQQITVVNNINVVNAVSLTNNICVCCFNSCNNNYYYNFYYPEAPTRALPPGASPPPPGATPPAAGPPKASPPAGAPKPPPPPGGKSPPPPGGKSPPPPGGTPPPPTDPTPPPPPTGSNPPPPVGANPPPPTAVPPPPTAVQPPPTPIIPGLDDGGATEITG